MKKTLLATTLICLSLNAYSAQTHVTVYVPSTEAKVNTQFVVNSIHGIYALNPYNKNHTYHWMTQICHVYSGNIPYDCKDLKTGHFTVEPGQVHEIHNTSNMILFCSNKPSHKDKSYAITQLVDDETNQIWKQEGWNDLICKK